MEQPSSRRRVLKWTSNWIWFFRLFEGWEKHVVYEAENSPRVAISHTRVPFEWLCSLQVPSSVQPKKVTIREIPLAWTRKSLKKSTLNITPLHIYVHPRTTNTIFILIGEIQRVQKKFIFGSILEILSNWQTEFWNLYIRIVPFINIL